jgi:hypothetical protein
MRMGVRSLVVLFGLVVSCAHATYQAPQPSATRDGVTLTVGAGPRCFVTRDDEKMPPPNNDNRFHVRTTVLVENHTDEVVQVAPEQVRLAVKGPGTGMRTEIPPIGGTVLAVQPGGSEIVPLNFEGPGPIDCHRPVDLDPRSSVTMADEPVWLSPIRLVPKP